MLPEVVVRFVELELKTRSVYEPPYVEAVGGDARLQLAKVFKLEFEPPNVFAGAAEKLMATVSELSPRELVAVRVTVKFPLWLEAPDMIPVSGSKVRPRGSVPMME